MCATYVCVCLTAVPGVARGDWASLMSDRRSQSGTGTTPMAPNFCAGAYPLGKTAKALPTRREGWRSVLRAYKTPIFAGGQKLTHSPAHEEKHAGQETPLHYTPYLQWHHPGGRALLQLAQVPTQDYHSYTQTLLGVVEDQVVGPNDPPVKKTTEHSAAEQLWPNRGATTRFPARAWREGVFLLRAQRGCRWSRTALATPG